MFQFIVITTLLALATANPTPLPRLDGRIVGGDEIDIADAPYQVSLQSYGSHICGGSILSEKFVVTAAHCTYGASESALSIRYGTSTRGNGGTVVKVKKINQHTGFSYSTLDNDITVLELEEDIIFGDNAEPIDFALTEPKDGDKLLVTGWGATTEGGWSSSKLIGVEVPAVDRDSCQEDYSGYTISPRMVCAGYPTGQKDACQGDSGGPLISIEEGKLVGIVSWGYGCARPHYPGVYSNVAALSDFIKEKTAL